MLVGLQCNRGDLLSITQHLQVGSVTKLDADLASCVCKYCSLALAVIELETPTKYTVQSKILVKSLTKTK